MNWLAKGALLPLQSVASQGACPRFLALPIFSV